MVASVTFTLLSLLWADILLEAARLTREKEMRNTTNVYLDNYFTEGVHKSKQTTKENEEKRNGVRPPTWKKMSPYNANSFFLTLTVSSVLPCPLSSALIGHF